MKNKKIFAAILCTVLTASAVSPVVTAEEASATKSDIYVNGSKADISGYNVNDNNYFKLRDLGKLLNFGVEWDEATNTIRINTSQSYREETTGSPAQTARMLAKNNWADATYDALNNLIKNNGILSSTYDAANKPYVVFDCDNTTVINDIEEALLIYQLENLRFRLTPDNIAEVLQTGIPDTEQPFVEDYRNADGEALNVKLIVDDCAADYEYLYKNYTGFGAGGDMTLDEIRNTDEYKDFTAKVRFLYSAVNDTFDASVGYPWVTYLFTGMTSGEVRALAEESHDYWLDYGEFTKVKWTSPETLKGEAGVVSVSYKTGLAFPEEMKDLYNTFMENGIDVYVCSASFYDVVVAAMTNPKYGYNVKEENVYAMRLKTDEQGRYINEYDDNYFQTQGKGKAYTINAYIRGRYGNRGPIFVAGDSSGDFNMITEYSDMQLGLIVNRVRSDSMKSISQEAAASIGNPAAKYVLQGRDENTGVFRPSEKSILLGETEEKLTK
ncbi:MAG: haloacid dehalogenase-like hydrolase [Candidatus Ornithomonoglobus sp.]